MKEFKLDKIKVDGTPASAASIASPGSSETVLMLPFEGSNNDTSTTDRSSTEHSITFNGDVLRRSRFKRSKAASQCFPSAKESASEDISIESYGDFEFESTN